MKRVSVRNFQLKPTKYLGDLPIILTKYNKDVAKVVPFSENVLTEKPEEPKNSDWEGQCQAPNQRCRSFGKKYVIMFIGDDGEQTVEQALCEEHLLLAKQQAESVELARSD